jgi:hypothetical protein
MNSIPDPAGLVRIDRAAKRFADAREIVIERARHRLMMLGQKREISMFVLGSGGGWERVPPWDLEHKIDWENGEIHQPGTGLVYLGDDFALPGVARYPALYVDEEELEALLKPSAPSAPPPAAPRRDPPSGGRPAHRPAMPEKEQARLQAFRRVYAFGLPKKSSILAAELDRYFCRTTKSPPSLRTIERWIAEWWEELCDMVQPPAVEATSNDRQN